LGAHQSSKRNEDCKGKEKERAARQVLEEKESKNRSNGTMSSVVIRYLILVLLSTFPEQLVITLAEG